MKYRKPLLVVNSAWKSRPKLTPPKCPINCRLVDNASMHWTPRTETLPLCVIFLYRNPLKSIFAPAVLLSDARHFHSPAACVQIKCGSLWPLWECARGWWAHICTAQRVMKVGFELVVLRRLSARLFCLKNETRLSLCHWIGFNFSRCVVLLRSFYSASNKVDDESIIPATIMQYLSAFQWSIQWLSIYLLHRESVRYIRWFCHPLLVLQVFQLKCITNQNIQSILISKKCNNNKLQSTFHSKKIASKNWWSCIAN